MKRTAASLTAVFLLLSLPMARAQTPTIRIPSTSSQPATSQPADETGGWKPRETAGSTPPPHIGATIHKAGSSSPTGNSSATASPVSTPARTTSSAPPSRSGASPAPLQPVRREGQPRYARVSNGNGGLPNDAGQVWREYDITPYTARVTNTKRPEQAIIDWILRETGYEVWHGEVVAVLTGDAKTLRVYHTPTVQATVADVVDRFVNPAAERQAFSVRVCSVGKPDWRSRAQRALRPIPVETPGVQAWLMNREDASLMLTDLARRYDFREYSVIGTSVNHGQTVNVTSTRPRNFLQGDSNAPAQAGAAVQGATLEEGFNLELSPLLALDGATADAAVRCTIDQVEKLHPVFLESLAITGLRQRTQVDIPQISQFRLYEKFRWPTDQILLVSMGMVPSPQPATTNVFGLPSLSSNRVDMLMFVEARAAAPVLPAAAIQPVTPVTAPGTGASVQPISLPVSPRNPAAPAVPVVPPAAAPGAPATGAVPPKNYHGRY